MSHTVIIREQSLMNTHGHDGLRTFADSSDLRNAIAMWIGWNEFDILLGDVHSLKGKRSIVRPIIAEIQKQFHISVAEVENAQLHRRTRLGVSVVGGDRTHLVEVLNRVEDMVANRPEIELLSSKLRLVQSTDF